MKRRTSLRSLQPCLHSGQQALSRFRSGGSLSAGCEEAPLWRGNSAFTLVELLVVMAITMLLTLVLLPALIRAKESARRARCFSNERQLFLAWTMYSDDTGRIAGNGTVRDGGDEIRPMWIQGYLNHHVSFQDGTNAALLVDARFAQFSSYISDIKIYKCPSDRGVVIDVNRGTKTTKLRSYAMNCYLGWIEGIGWKPKGPIFQKEQRGPRVAQDTFERRVRSKPKLLDGDQRL